MLFLNTSCSFLTIINCSSDHGKPIPAARVSVPEWLKYLHAEFRQFWSVSVCPLLALSPGTNCLISLHYKGGVLVATNYRADFTQG